MGCMLASSIRSVTNSLALMVCYLDNLRSEMIKDGGTSVVLHNCLLAILNLMLINHFPKQC